MSFNKRMLVSSIIFGFLSTCNGFSSANEELVNSENRVVSNAELNTDMQNTSMSNSANLEKPVESKENIVPEESKDADNKSSNSSNLGEISEETKASENRTVEKMIVPYAVLNMPKELIDKPVLYRIKRGDCLTGIAYDLFESAKDWRWISELEANCDSIGDNGDLIIEDDMLYIPQPKHGHFKLYNPKTFETWTSISRKIYGSSAWSTILKEYNEDISGITGDHPRGVSELCVIKLPSKIYFGDYVIPQSGGTTSFDHISFRLFGSSEYAEEIAKFNDSDLERILFPGDLIHIPPSITLKKINIINTANN